MTWCWQWVVLSVSVKLNNALYIFMWIGHDEGEDEGESGLKSIKRQISQILKKVFLHDRSLFLLCFVLWAVSSLPTISFFSAVLLSVALWNCCVCCALQSKTLNSAVYSTVNKLLTQKHEVRICIHSNSGSQTGGLPKRGLTEKEWGIKGIYDTLGHGHLSTIIIYHKFVLVSLSISCNNWDDIAGVKYLSKWFDLSGEKVKILPHTQRLPASTAILL